MAIEQHDTSSVDSAEPSQGRALALVEHRAVAPRTFDGATQEALAALKAAITKDLTNEEFAVFIEASKARGLNPFTRQIYGWKDQGKLTMQVSIDGLRAIAERSGLYAGRVGPQWCGRDGVWREVWLEDEPPAAARVGVKRRDFDEITWGVARFKSYNKGNYVWKQYPDVMIAKVAESVALRAAFPEGMGGLYTEDEMSNTPFVDGSLASSEQPQPATQPSQAQAAATRRQPAPSQPAAKEATKDYALRMLGISDEQYMDIFYSVAGRKDKGAYTKADTERVRRDVDLRIRAAALGMDYDAYNAFRVAVTGADAVMDGTPYDANDLTAIEGALAEMEAERQQAQAENIVEGEAVEA